MYRGSVMTTSTEQLAGHFPSLPVSARQARGFVRAELRQMGGTDEVIDDLDLVVSELMANAIQHGNGSDILVAVDGRSAMWFAVTVSNGVAASLPSMDPTKWAVAATERPSGRGLGIIRRLADEIDVAESAGQLHVTCRRRR